VGRDTKHDPLAIFLPAMIALILVMGLVAPWRLDAPAMNATETVAIRELQIIHQAETHYFSRYGRYTVSFDELASLDEIGPAEKGGYLFSISLTASGYEIRAKPKIFGSTGRRSFYSDETMTIRQNWSPDAGPLSPVLK
jgi:hypothetical protein